MWLLPVMVVPIIMAFITIYFSRQKCIAALESIPQVIIGDRCAELKYFGVVSMAIHSGANSKRKIMIVYSYKMKSGCQGSINQIVYPDYMKHEIYPEPRVVRCGE